MKVWIDGQLKIDFKGIASKITQAKVKSKVDRYGLYNSSMSRYKNIFETRINAQRIIFFDGVLKIKSEKLFNKCEKLSLKAYRKV